MSLKDFNKKFMVVRESSEDENTASTSQSRTSLSVTEESLVSDKQVVKEEEKATPESPKDKLVENDKQW